MNQLKFNVLGLMSGTSLDGLDICFCQFSQSNNSWQFSVQHTETIDYSKAWKTKLGTAQNLNAVGLSALDAEFGFFLAEAVNTFIAKHRIQNIDFIGSHGHTVLHQPEKKITLQIGNGPELHEYTGLKTICDFRLQDILLGGQGAPLVPIGDELLFSNYEACLNLGGFANISLRDAGQRTAFDICPVNIVLNEVCQKLDLNFDKGGNLARSGKLIPELFKRLNSLDFYTQSAPKSLGREWVEENILPKIPGYTNYIDVLHTFTEHAALQVATILKPIKGDVLATGGGTFNGFLIERINFLSRKKLVIPTTEIINFKEAIIFAFLAVLRFNNKENCLRSVTGASKNHSSGRIYG